MKKSILIAGVIIIFALIGAGAVWYVKNNKSEPINMPITESEQEQVTTTTTTTEPFASSTPELDTSEWLTYRNKEYGYTLLYPNNWAMKDVNYYENDLGIGVKYTSFVNNDYYLVFLLNKIDENFNYGRTGIGAGDFIKVKEFKAAGLDITINNLVYKGKTREIFFSGRNESYNISGYFSYLGDNYDDPNFNFNEDKFKIAEKIIKSLSL